MHNFKKETAGNAFYVSDCYVWSAIYYLDSPTNYREYIPHYGVSPAILRDNLVMLDSSTKRISLPASFHIFSISLLVFLIGILLLYLGC
jgi:hypothetical protein